jgi:hypothetical protein
VLAGAEDGDRFGRRRELSMCLQGIGLVEEESCLCACRRELSICLQMMK